jgi:uncharacterized protein YndB with AHSA1/START domain
MTKQATGRLIATALGADLVLERTFRADVEDVWASLTESERTARWFASWTGTPGPGRTIRYRLIFEEGMPEGDMTIDECEPPHRLAVSTTDESGTWRLEARIRPAGDRTILTFTHHLEDPSSADQVGPGWEYYLDNLVASRTGDPLPKFDDYYPALEEPYRDMLAAISASR